MPPVCELTLRDACRLLPCANPARGVLEAVAAPEDLVLMLELESWTNDRVSAEAGTLYRLPAQEWVRNRPLADLINAAFCYPAAESGRFNGVERSAWHAATSVTAAHAEAVYFRAAELAEIGVSDTRVEMRLYLADFRGAFHDIRAGLPGHAPYHDPISHRASQRLARQLLAGGSNGVIYRSVRHPGAECVACFRPGLVANVRAGACYEYRWAGRCTARIRRLG
ncbi:MAG TPA: RES family NAD+ phosphorylase [Bryobacteraceae bacterium]|nr:RES family NAD+ phosphorylase [Bryobacteraceae bacterium]